MILQTMDLFPGISFSFFERAKQFLFRFRALMWNAQYQNLENRRIYLRPGIIRNREHLESDLSGLRFQLDDLSLIAWYNGKTGFLEKEEWQSPRTSLTISYDDYRPVDGVLLAHRMKWILPDATWEVYITSVEQITPEDDQLFGYPQLHGQRPLPKLDEFLPKLSHNQEAVMSLREEYTFRKTEITSNLDDSGRIKESERKEYDVTPVRGEFVDRLVAVDNTPLDEKQQRKEDNRVRREVEEILKKNDSSSREEDEVTILDFLRTSRFLDIRRERLGGKEMIVFDFEPETTFKAKTRQENLISKLAGTLWIDEHEQQVVRLEARFTESFKMGFGLLASIRPSTAFVFEQELVDHRVWLPSYMEANVSARALLFMDIRIRQITRFSDYQKLSVDSEYRLNVPGEDKRIP